MSKSIITVHNINKIAHNRLILSDVSFSIDTGSLVSIIGPNGAGKSTLVKILLGFDSDYRGTVAIASEEQVAYIPQMQAQDPSPIPLSVREYIAIGTSAWYSGRSASSFNLEKILDHVGVAADRLSQSFWSLSGGERQRIAIARALISNPSILVLDEPLSAVDYASRHDLYELIRHLQQDHSMTVILVSHDIDSVLPISDRVLCLNHTLHEDCHPRDYSGGIRGVHHHC